MYRPSGTENEKTVMQKSAHAQGLVVVLTNVIVPRSVATEAMDGFACANPGRIRHTGKSEVT
jgi:hypothetical protein